MLFFILSLFSPLFSLAISVVQFVLMVLATFTIIFTIDYIYNVYFSPILESAIATAFNSIISAFSSIFCRITSFSLRFLVLNLLAKVNPPEASFQVVLDHTLDFVLTIFEATSQVVSILAMRLVPGFFSVFSTVLKVIRTSVGYINSFITFLILLDENIVPEKVANDTEVQGSTSTFESNLTSTSISDSDSSDLFALTATEQSQLESPSPTQIRSQPSCKPRRPPVSVGNMKGSSNSSSSKPSSNSYRRTSSVLSFEKPSVSGFSDFSSTSTSPSAIQSFKTVEGTTALNSATVSTTTSTKLPSSNLNSAFSSYNMSKCDSFHSVSLQNTTSNQNTVHISTLPTASIDSNLATSSTKTSHLGTSSFVDTVSSGTSSTARKPFSFSSTTTKEYAGFNSVPKVVVEVTSSLPTVGIRTSHPDTNAVVLENTSTIATSSTTSRLISPPVEVVENSFSSLSSDFHIKPVRKVIQSSHIYSSERAAHQSHGLPNEKETVANNHLAERAERAAKRQLKREERRRRRSTASTHQSIAAQVSEVSITTPIATTSSRPRPRTSRTERQPSAAVGVSTSSSSSNNRSSRSTNTRRRAAPPTSQIRVTSNGSTMFANVDDILAGNLMESVFDGLVNQLGVESEKKERNERKRSWREAASSNRITEILEIDGGDRFEEVVEEVLPSAKRRRDEEEEEEVAAFSSRVSKKQRRQNANE